MKVKMKAKVLSFLVVCLLAKTAFATSPVRSWATDMYNQQAIKPFAAGSVLAFPVGSISTKGVMIHSSGFKNAYAENLPWNDFSPQGFRYNPKLTPQNPLAAKDLSLEQGEYLFNVYCAACHGVDGKSANNVGKLRAAPAIDVLVPKFSEGYVYTRITYGGPAVPTTMPPFAYSLSNKERWVLANYVKKKFL